MGAHSSQAPVEHAAAGSPQAPGPRPPGQHPAGRPCQDRPIQRSRGNQRVPGPSLCLVSSFRVSGDEGRQGWLGQRRVSGLGAGGSYKAFSWRATGALSEEWTARSPCWSSLFSKAAFSCQPPLPLLGEEVGWWEGSWNIFGGCPSRLVHPLGSQRLLDVRERGQDCISGWGVCLNLGCYLGPQPSLLASQALSLIGFKAKRVQHPLLPIPIGFSTGPDSSASSSPHSPICSTSRRDGCRSWTSLER